MPRSPALAIALAATAAGSAVVLFVATQTWGLGVSYDSVVYVQASHRLSAIPLPQPRDLGGQALYWWGPVYPLVLKAVGAGYSGARILNAILLCAGSLLVGAVTWRSVGARAGLTAGVLYALSPAVFAAHLNLLAEPLYLLLATGGLALVAARRPVPAGLVAGAATLARYAGLPLIVAGAVVLRGRDRLKFLAVSLSLYLGWIVRNQLAAGQTTGRVPRWHPPSWSVVDAGGHELVRLLITPGRLPSLHLPFVHAGAIAQVVAAASLSYALVRADRRAPPPLVRLGLIYAGLYIAFLALTISLFDAGTPIDERLLVPLVPPLVVAFAWLARSLPIVAAVLCCVFGVAMLQEARSADRYGVDYSGRIWSAARIRPAELPPGQLYSNWPAAIAYFTGRSPREIPRPVDSHTHATNSRYARELDDLARAVRTGRASLVLLSDGFLQIHDVGTPLEETAPFRADCRPVTQIVTICTTR